MGQTIEQALQEGITAHKKGNLRDAERCYRVILQSQPSHPDANHNLGVIAVLANKTDTALRLFQIALEANPNIEQYWHSYVDTLVKTDQLQTAKKAVKTAEGKGFDTKKLEALLHQPVDQTISQGPSQAQIGAILEHYQNGNYLEAEKLATMLTQEFPQHPFGWKTLGVVLRKEGRIDESIVASQKSVHLAPGDTEAHSNLGNALRELGRLEEAVVSFSEAIALKPDSAIAHSNLGYTLKELGRLDEAEASLTRAIALQPDLAEAHNNLGITLKELGRLIDAEKSYNQAIMLNPDYAEAYSNLGLALKELGRLDEAEASLTQAISLKPGLAGTYNNLGLSLEELGRSDEAEESFRQAIALKPDLDEAHNNLGLTLKELGRLDEAEASYNQAIALKPDLAEAHYNLARLHLLQGKLDEGLQAYDWRLKVKDNIAPLPNPNFAWGQNSGVRDKRFLVYEEQGLGDIIQFSRYLTMLEDKGAIVTFKVTPRLHKLLRTMRNRVKLIEGHHDESEKDFEIPLMSLPLMFKTNIDNIPSQNSYLYADPEKVKSISGRLSGRNFKIGICWQGAISKIDTGRSFPLALFSEISALPDIELVSLHKGEGESQLTSIDFRLNNLGPSLDTEQDAFLDTAAVMMNCDLIITSDTAIAHLAGALGCPTWVALKYIPDWRWMLESTTTPWYPSMRLYRQNKLGDWDSVFDRLKKDLSKLME